MSDETPPAEPPAGPSVEVVGTLLHVRELRT
jgi:hypothetical protein